MPGRYDTVTMTSQCTLRGSHACACVVTVLAMTTGRDLVNRQVTRSCRQNCHLAFSLLTGKPSIAPTRWHPYGLPTYLLSTGVISSQRPTASSLGQRVGPGVRAMQGCITGCYFRAPGARRACTAYCIAPRAAWRGCAGWSRVAAIPCGGADGKCAAPLWSCPSGGPFGAGGLRLCMFILTPRGLSLVCGTCAACCSITG
jgi:hypothetical protein